MLVRGSHFTAKINKFISLTLWSITTVMQCKLKYKLSVCYSDITMLSDSLNYMYITVCLSVCLIQVKVEVGRHCPSDWVPFVILGLAWVCACMHNKTWNRRTWVLTQLASESKKKQHKNNWIYINKMQTKNAASERKTNVYDFHCHELFYMFTQPLVVLCNSLALLKVNSTVV